MNIILKQMKRNFLRTAILLLLSITAMLGRAQKADSVRILWIGNSYTYVNDLPEMVKTIAFGKGKLLSTTRMLKGGERLSGHLANEKLRSCLKKGGFHYVILQEQSAAPSMSTQQVAEKVYAPAEQLVKLIREGSPEAKILFYMTWGHKYGNQQEEKTPYALNNTYEDMQQRLKTSYLEMAHANHAICAPVGMAWQRVRSEKPDLTLYDPDGSHPSKAGTYLAANVFFGIICGEPYQTSYSAGLNEETAAYLQRIAHETVFGNKELINLK